MAGEKPAEIATPVGISAARDFERRLVGVRNHHVARNSHQRLMHFAKPGALGAVAIKDAANHGTQRNGDNVYIVRRRPIGVFRDGDSVPKWRMRALQWS